MFGSLPAEMSWWRKYTTVCVRPTANAGMMISPAAIRGASHNFAKLVRGLGYRLVHVAAVSAFADEQIARWYRLWVAQDRKPRSAHIAGEGQVGCSPFGGGVDVDCLTIAEPSR